MEADEEAARKNLFKGKSFPGSYISLLEQDTLYHGSKTRLTAQESEILFILMPMREVVTSQKIRHAGGFHIKSTRKLFASAEMTPASQLGSQVGKPTTACPRAASDHLKVPREMITPIPIPTRNPSES